jgi:arsenate reductase
VQAGGGSVWQVFGTKKCSETRKALRFFKERGVRIQEIDLGQRGMSPGELKSVAAQHGWSSLLDREGARFRDRGLAHSRLTDPEVERLLAADAALLRTPIVRRGQKSTVGYQPDVWQAWLAAG